MNAPVKLGLTLFQNEVILVGTVIATLPQFVCITLQLKAPGSYLISGLLLQPCVSSYPTSVSQNNAILIHFPFLSQPPSSEILSTDLCVVTRISAALAQPKPELMESQSAVQSRPDSGWRLCWEKHPQLCSSCSSWLTSFLLPFHNTAAVSFFARA